MSTRQIAAQRRSGTGRIRQGRPPRARIVPDAIRRDGHIAYALLIETTGWTTRPLAGRRSGAGVAVVRGGDTGWRRRTAPSGGPSAAEELLDALMGQTEDVGGVADTQAPRPYQCPGRLPSGAGARTGRAAPARRESGTSAPVAGPWAMQPDGRATS